MPISVSCFAQRTKKELIARKYRSSIEINKLSPLLRYFFPFDIYLIFSFGFRFAIKIFRLKFSNEAPFGQVFFHKKCKLHNYASVIQCRTTKSKNDSWHRG